MSGTVIYTPATGADWATAWEQAEYTRKGKMGISLTNMTATTLPAIASGSWCEVAGSIYKWTVEEAISGSPTAGLINYITLVPSGSGDTAILTPTWSTTAPTWSDAYLGWYSSTTRYVARCFYTGSEYIDKQVVPCERSPVIPYDVAPQNYIYDSMRIAGFADDFLSGNVTGLYGLLKTQMIAGGTLANLVGSENHPGIMRFANEAVSGGGYNLHTETDSIVVTGKETIEYIFKIAVTTNCVARLGFHDTLTTSSPTDGLYLFIGGTTLNGRSFNNTATSTTGSSYTITQGDWYRGKVQVNADATRCDYFLYSEAGALVWHDYLTTNLPVGRNLGIVIQIYNTSSGAANTGDLDYLAFWCDRVLTR